MITLYDYLPSQNCWKVRQLLAHLEIPYRTELVSIFEGEGQTAEHRARNPWGAVPALRLEDGRVLAESNAILCYLAANTRFRPSDRFLEAKMLQWMSFEADYVQASIGSLRYWTLTGKLERRPAQFVASRVAIADRALRVLDAELRDRPFLIGPQYTAADISMFAYAHLAHDAGLDTAHLPGFRGWVERVRAQPNFLAKVHPYSIDPHSASELP